MFVKQAQAEGSQIPCLCERTWPKKKMILINESVVIKMKRLIVVVLKI